MTRAPSTFTKWMVVMVLSLAALPASLGAETACLIRDELVLGGHFRDYFDADPDQFAGRGPIGNLYGVATGAVLMIAWIVAMCAHMAWVRLDRLRWLMIGAPILIFVWSATNVYRMAWPVCNAF